MHNFEKKINFCTVESAIDNKKSSFSFYVEMSLDSQRLIRIWLSVHNPIPNNLTMSTNNIVLLWGFVQLFEYDHAKKYTVRQHLPRRVHFLLSIIQRGVGIFQYMENKHLYFLHLRAIPNYLMFPCLKKNLTWKI